MEIKKLEFYINPLKLFEFLDEGERKGNLVILHDATEKGYTFIAYGKNILTAKNDCLTPENLRELFSSFEDKLVLKKKALELYFEDFEFAHEVSEFPFLDGMIGFMSYDLGLGFENITSKCPDDQSYPSYFFVEPEELIVFDHENKHMWVVFSGDGDMRFFENLKHVHFKESEFLRDNETAFRSNLTESEYTQKILNVKEYLEKGETYQVNFSQRFCFDNYKSPWAIYKSVTEINPTKYQAFLSGDLNANEKFWVICNSPERLFRISNTSEGRKIETRPIKGTIGLRGSEGPEGLKALSATLVLSDKDRAELEMIVDMSRNDLGRVCEFGTVHVDEHRVVEKYSHLLHTVSNVSGVLKDTAKLYDVMRAMFPGASITGCPKKRTMEIIDQLEDYSRGVYCGSMGYLDCRGNADFNIMIRTLFAKQDGDLYRYVMHSGGGIVMDSNPALEFNETFDKVNAFLDAINSN